MRRHHAVERPRWRCIRRIEVQIPVEVNHAESRAVPGEAGQYADRDRAITAEHEQKTVGADETPERRGDVAARAYDEVEILLPWVLRIGTKCDCRQIAFIIYVEAVPAQGFDQTRRA